MRLQDSRLGYTVAERTVMLGRVIVKVSDIDFDLQDSQFDVLGTAYMILIGLFASDAGKKGGEFFTPVGPSRLCATLASLGLDEAKTVGDCTCGSASMLLEVQKHLTTHKVGHFYGQELNATTYNLSRMNMIMHGVDWQNFDIYKGDTLKDDMNGDDLKLTVQVCNPPYSLKWSADKKFEDDPRYSGAGKLAPKSAADLAFVEHMIYHMDDSDGRAAVLLPHGVLFRGGAEETIRKYIIKDLNRLDAVIGLPANLFHGTGIPVCVLVLRSNRNGNSGNILFIDASKDFKAGKNQNILEQEHIDKIVDAYVKRVDIDKFAHVADMSEIIENGYNLNIPRYVDTFEEEEPVDLEAVVKEIEDCDREIFQTEQNMGLMQIPLDFVVGTATKGRTYSFAANFMPILDADTEFACKWIALSDAQVNEGIRDPIVAYEYMNRYYVVEGNKRVSVLKYFKADSIVANVTRKIPKYSEDEDVKLYYEYMKFNQISGLNNIEFSKIGMVDKLLALMGSTAIWDADTRMEFNSLVNHFTNA